VRGPMDKRRDSSQSNGDGSEDPRRSAESDERGAPGAPSDGVPFAVVGIGASAGGLEAFRGLLGSLPKDTGMAYVVVQHLSPDHPSILAQTLARFTSMPVLEIHDATPLAPNHVYVMPANAEVVLSRRTLRLVPRPPRRAAGSRSTRCSSRSRASCAAARSVSCFPGRV
jgi:chemotaxis response regulator CheB